MTTYDNSLFAKLETKEGYSATNESSILNPYVAFNKHENTQTLSDVLVAEAIQMRGVECYYLPREFQKLDALFGEDLYNKFTKAWKFACYLDSFDAYSGANTFYSKFGMSVNDEITISINPNLFKHQVNGVNPREGDLIYFKMDNSLFEITWVQPYEPFYQNGTNSIQKITAQKFIYSGEKITPELQVNDGFVPDEFDGLELEPIHELNDMTNHMELDEVKTIQKEADKFVDPYVVVNANSANPFTEEW